MTEIDDGGPAFPMAHLLGPPDKGMSLRDWFAGQALMGFLANQTTKGDADAYACDAYKAADAMLAARSAKR